MTTHRGRTKIGKTAITICLTSEEIAALDRLAETHLRSRTGHATWLILHAIREVTK